ncbi:unnamed protein product [Caenorhabditis brenneri]
MATCTVTKNCQSFLPKKYIATVFSEFWCTRFLKASKIYCGLASTVKEIAMKTKTCLNWKCVTSPKSLAPCWRNIRAVRAMRRGRVACFETHDTADRYALRDHLARLNHAIHITPVHYKKGYYEIDL